MTSKKEAAAASALSALGVGRNEQSKRMVSEGPAKPAPERVQMSVQFTMDGLALLQRAQARLLERGVRRANQRGAALEAVLKEWLERENP